jgi:hypothetical protein
MYPPISESRALDIKQGFSNYEEGSPIMNKTVNLKQ